MKKTAVLLLLCFCSLVVLPAAAQNTLPEMEEVLLHSTAAKMGKVFDTLKTMVGKLPYNDAIVCEDALLHTAAALPHYQEAFGWVCELTKVTYGDSAHADDLFLYLLSITDDSAFQKPAIQSKLQYEVGHAYYNMGDYEKAQVTLEKFMLNDKAPVNRDLINGLTMLGLINQDRRNFNEALLFLQLALAKATALKDTVWIGLANGNLGSLYLDMGKLSESLPLIYLDVSSSIKNSLYESAANDYYDLSNIAFGQNRPAWAKRTLDSAMLMLGLDNRPYRKSWARVYKNLARYHHLSGRQDSAYYYLLLAQQIMDSLQNNHNESLLKLRVNAFSQQKNDHDALLLKASVEISMQSRRLALIATVGTAIVAALGLLYIRQKKRVNRVLREKAVLIEKERQEEETRRKKEEAANHAKGKLFSLVAHDLRGPIGGLGMLLEMMGQGGMTTQEFTSLLPDIKLKVDTLYKVTDNLLRWAYSQLDGSIVKKELFNVNGIIHNVTALLKDDAAKKSITLLSDAAADLSLVADANQLEVVIRNLVGNALKFSPPGSAIRIQGGINNQQAVIKVIDQGPGLPGSVYRNLQQGEFSNPSAGTAGEKGAGLGLVMCKEFVEANGGRLDANPNIPNGTVFTLAFPIV